MSSHWTINETSIDELRSPDTLNFRLPGAASNLNATYKLHGWVGIADWLGCGEPVHPVCHGFVRSPKPGNSPGRYGWKAGVFAGAGGADAVLPDAEISGICRFAETCSESSGGSLSSIFGIIRSCPTFLRTTPRKAVRLITKTDALLYAKETFA